MLNKYCTDIIYIYW